MPLLLGSIQNLLRRQKPLVKCFDFASILQNGWYKYPVDLQNEGFCFDICIPQFCPNPILKAKPKLLEPIMRVEVVTPDDYMGDVIGDLNSRRGNIQGMEPGGKSTIISAMVPLATMFGYVNNLRSITQGRAQYSMFFDCYKHVPQMVAAEMQAKLA